MVVSQPGPEWQGKLKQLSKIAQPPIATLPLPPNRHPPRLFTEFPIPIEMGLVASPQLPCPHCAFSCEKQEAGTFGSSAAPSTLNIYLGVQVRALEPKKFTTGEGDGQDSWSGKIFSFVFGQQRRQ